MKTIIWIALLAAAALWYFSMKKKTEPETKPIGGPGYEPFMRAITDKQTDKAVGITTGTKLSPNAGLVIDLTN